jgi:ADP-L-glycero-D-manno-heptose 6-epimerase
MIVVTGAGGFIGSNLVARLNKEGYRDLVLVDDFASTLQRPSPVDGTHGCEPKENRLKGLTYTRLLHRDYLMEWLEEQHRWVQYVFHLGARTDTMLHDRAIFDKLNLGYSKDLWNACSRWGLPILYASSAATYGLGEHGFKDGISNLAQLRPLNPYGDSKHQFDCWMAQCECKPLQWVGLKFFNVFGPGEGHKGPMASVVWHASRQIMTQGKARLFKSHHPDFKDGEQQRDFIYVDDVTEICLWFMKNRQHSGLFNLGTGKASTFRDLILALFEAKALAPQIEFVDTPEHLRAQYQYYTCADMVWLHRLNCPVRFSSLFDGVLDYNRRELSVVHPLPQA